MYESKASSAINHHQTAVQFTRRTTNPYMYRISQRDELQAQPPSHAVYYNHEQENAG